MTLYCRCQSKLKERKQNVLPKFEFQKLDHPGGTNSLTSWFGFFEWSFAVFFFFFLAILLCLVVTSVSFLCCCAPPPVSLPPHTCLTSVSPPAPLPLISLLYISTSLLFPHSLLVRLLSPCFRLHASCAPVPVFAGPCVFTVFQISSLWFSGLLLVFALLWCFPLLTVLVASFCFCVSTFVTWISYFGVWLSVLKLRFYSLPAYLCVE